MITYAAVAPSFVFTGLEFLSLWFAPQFAHAQLRIISFVLSLVSVSLSVCQIGLIFDCSRIDFDWDFGSIFGYNEALVFSEYNKTYSNWKWEIFVNTSQKFLHYCKSNEKKRSKPTFSITY